MATKLESKRVFFEMHYKIAKGVRKTRNLLWNAQEEFYCRVMVLIIARISVRKERGETVFLQATVSAIFRRWCYKAHLHAYTVAFLSLIAWVEEMETWTTFTCSTNLHAKRHKGFQAMCCTRALEMPTQRHCCLFQLWMGIYML